MHFLRFGGQYHQQRASHDRRTLKRRLLRRAPWRNRAYGDALSAEGPQASTELRNRRHGAEHIRLWLPIGRRPTAASLPTLDVFARLDRAIALNHHRGHELRTYNPRAELCRHSRAGIFCRGYDSAEDGSLRETQRTITFPLQNQPVRFYLLQAQKCVSWANRVGASA